MVEECTDDSTPKLILEIKPENGSVVQSDPDQMLLLGKPRNNTVACSRSTLLSEMSQRVQNISQLLKQFEKGEVQPRYVENLRHELERIGSSASVLAAQTANIESLVRLLALQVKSNTGESSAELKNAQSGAGLSHALSMHQADTQRVLQEVNTMVMGLYTKIDMLQNNLSFLGSPEWQQAWLAAAELYAAFRWFRSMPSLLQKVVFAIVGCGQAILVLFILLWLTTSLNNVDIMIKSMRDSLVAIRQMFFG